MKLILFIVLVGAYSINAKAVYPPADCLAAFNKAILDQINFHRYNHNSGSVTWHSDPSVIKRTQDWVYTQTDQYKGGNKNPALPSTMNELIASISQDPPFGLTPVECANHARLVVSFWYNGPASNYNYVTQTAKHCANVKYPDFTQLLWKSSKQISCAFSINDKKEAYGTWFLFAACDWDQKGNVGDVANYRANVLPPISNPITTLKSTPATTTAARIATTTTTTTKPTTTTTQQTNGPVFVNTNTCIYELNFYGLTVTNRLRKLHGLSPLTAITDPAINKMTQDYACQLATKFVTAHNPAAKAAGYGENIYFSFDSTPFSMRNCLTTAEKAVNAWYAEINNYDFDRGVSKNGGVIGHFTQLVWKSTTQVNFALCASSVKDSRGAYWTVVVANYFRAGNLIGSYTANVPKLI